MLANLEDYPATDKNEQPQPQLVDQAAAEQRLSSMIEQQPIKLKDLDNCSNEERAILIQEEIRSIRAQRNWCCASFLSLESSLHEICIALDKIGKRSVDYYLLATVHAHCKSLELL
jgi:hypothetical protein